MQLRILAYICIVVFDKKQACAPPPIPFGAGKRAEIPSLLFFYAQI